jgi:hypothetical protein
MDLRPEDTTLILDGTLRIDDSDRIGQITRDAQRYATNLQAIEANLLSLLEAAQTRIEAANAALEQSITETLAALRAALTDAVDHALTTAAALETMLTTTSSAQITKADLDTLDTQGQGLKSAAQGAADRVDMMARDEGRPADPPEA